MIGQVNNAMLYPGLGLGTTVTRSRLITVGMLAAAANALSSLVAVRLPGASLARSSSRLVTAVAASNDAVTDLSAPSKALTSSVRASVSGSAVDLSSSLGRPLEDVHQLRAVDESGHERLAAEVHR